MAKLSLDDLKKLRESKRNEMHKRDPHGKEIQVIVGMGTCGIAAGAKKTVDAFTNALDSRKMGHSVMVRQTGCMGLCKSEPTVEVIAPGMPPVIYGKVDAGLAEKIVNKHIIGKEILNDCILDRSTANKNTK